LRRDAQHDGALVLGGGDTRQATLLLEYLYDLRCRGPGGANEAGERRRAAREPVGPGQKAQGHPFAVPKPVPKALEAPEPRSRNQEFDGFAFYRHNTTLPERRRSLCVVSLVKPLFMSNNPLALKGKPNRPSQLRASQIDPRNLRQI